MKLKSVELIGFKSFAKKTKIDFPNGITEIVGPNGSGKSNIIEAIRWALGEQSAKNLRSSKMTDVIFSGSQSHPALNRAKVALVFDNHDHFIDVNYTEIRVARTVYRDGTNNYYLNGKLCRLRDIQDLFMNTGIGNGSFSIISQGRVAQIFKSKPIDRRFIIETVAGIYKYRSQKEIAAKKLVHVDNNLARIDDINYELSHRLQSLNKEQHNAQQYLAQKRIANHLDIQRLSIRFIQLHQKLQQIKNNSQQVKIKIGQLRHQINNFKLKSSQIHDRLKELTSQYNRTQKAILDKARRLDNLSDQNSLSHQKLSFWHKQIGNSQTELRNDHLQMKNLSNKKALLRRRLNNVNQQNIIINKRIKQLNIKYKPMQLKTHQQRMNQLRASYIKLVKQMAQLKGKIDNYRQNRQQQQFQSERTRSQLASVKRLVKRAQQQLFKNSNRLIKLTEHKKRVQGNDAQLHSRYQDVSNRLHAIHKAYNLKTRQNQIFQIRINGLKRISARHTNLYNGPRNLLNQRNQFPGILGPVANFIKAPTKYVQALETTLRSQLQQIIVDNRQTAREVVQFMSKNHLGRVTLLPVNAITKRWINPSIITKCRQIPGFINVASKLVEMPNRFLDVKLHLLGNVIIARDISSAIKISKAIDRRYRVVTLDGNVVNAGGAITGGHGKYRYHGLLSQKAKVEQYQQRVKALSVVIRQQKKHGIKLDQRLIYIKKNLQINQSKINYDQQQIVIKTNLKTRLTDELHNYQGLFNQHQQPTNDSENQVVRIKDLQITLKHVRQRLNQCHTDLNRQGQIIKQQASTIRTYEATYQKFRENLIRNRDQQSQVSHNFKVTNHQIKQIKCLIIKRQYNIRHIHQLIKHQNHHIHTNSNLIKISKSIDKLNLKKDRYYELLSHNHEASTELSSRLSKDEEQLMETKTQFNQSRLDFREISRKLREVGEVLFRKYQIDVTKTNLAKPKASLYQISSKLFQAQRRLQALGPVNVDSIKQFKKVNHRYQFLSNQVNDLVTSKHQLTTTMSRMNSTIRVRFKNTFDQINAAFKVTYSQIFKGGRAKLALIDPKHLLTTGINIMAQPPGKRYRSMELLSGGERALTAIALLFAILRIKPAPFCILDEAESALDAVNIDRFGNYMQKLKAKTQFIVITHRKTTMLYADNLYGVTMQNSGISKIISVNLRKAKTEG